MKKIISLIILLSTLSFAQTETLSSGDTISYRRTSDYGKEYTNVALFDSGATRTQLGIDTFLVELKVDTNWIPIRVKNCVTDSTHLYILPTWTSVTIPTLYEIPVKRVDGDIRVRRTNVANLTRVSWVYWYVR